MWKTHRCSEQAGSDTRVPGGAVGEDPGTPCARHGPSWASVPRHTAHHPAGMRARGRADAGPLSGLRLAALRPGSGGPPPTAPTAQTGTQRPEDPTHLPVEKGMAMGRCLDAPAPPEGTHPEWPTQTHPGVRGALPPKPGWPVDTPGAGPGAPAAPSPRHLPGQSLVSQSTNACQGLRGPGPQCVPALPRGAEGTAETQAGSGLTPKRATG